jgi:hypothetical protein
VGGVSFLSISDLVSSRGGNFSVADTNIIRVVIQELE